MDDDFPYLIDANEAIQYYRAQDSHSDPIVAYVIRLLSLEGFSNSSIRTTLEIEKIYTVSHLKRAGTQLSIDELILWHKNPDRITLGHVRAIALLPRPKREPLLRQLLVSRYSVREYEALAHDRLQEKSIDVKRFEDEVSSKLGRPVAVSYNPTTKVGTLTMTFYGWDDLDGVLDKQGALMDELY